MTATLPSNLAEAFRTLAELLRPAGQANGHEPETRAVYSGLSWQRYLAVDEALGEDRSGPRLYYLDGDLEIMSTSNEHERLTEWLGGFMDLYFDEARIRTVTRGHATMQLADEAAAEPDKSWCISPAKLYPDVVLEIALTSGGVGKLALYQRFKVPEVWFWRRGDLEVHALRTDSSGYDLIGKQSRLLPALNIALLEHCASLPDVLDARQAFRAGLAASR